MQDARKKFFNGLFWFLVGAPLWFFLGVAFQQLIQGERLLR
jgi:hypothetical protein